MKRAGLFSSFCAVILLAVLLAGCGYHLSGMSGKMPGEITALSIPVFSNATGKPDIEAALTAAFTTEFATTVQVSENADAVLQGVIKSYDLQSVSYSKDDVNQEYRLTLIMSLKMTKKDGTVLWDDGKVTDYWDFAVNSSDITVTKEAENEAFKKIAKDTARLVKERMMEKF